VEANVSKPTKSKSRPQFSRAELKAYEARRAEEVRRVPIGPAGAEGVPVRRSYALTRDEEYAVIRADLRRLLLIVLVLFAILVVAMIVLR
jgi:hypothetical protein